MRPWNLLSAAGLGAAGMYLLDPRRGRRRRAMLRDKAVHTGRVVDDAAGVVRRDAWNRTRGLFAGLRARLSLRPPDDRKLAERIRSRLGFLVRHPSSIEVHVQHGRVTLSGPVLADEVDRLLARVTAMRGVRQVEDRLTAHQEPGNVPGLQGEPARRRGEGGFPLLQGYWSPTARVVAGAGGGALTLLGMRRGGLAGGALGLGGLALLLRGLTNLDLSRLLGAGAGRHAVTVQKTITVDAPVEEVFAFWDHYENFPRFMAHVREVRAADAGRSHWVMAGPLGVAVTWDTEVSEYVRNERMGWRTVPGSAVEHAGLVRFEPAEGGTRIHVRMSYSPPAGALGHTVAALLGRHPKRAMDHDLARFKSLIEEGKTTARGEAIRRDQLGA